MAASPTPSDIERIIAKQNAIAARQDEIALLMRELTVEVRALVVRMHRADEELSRPLDRYKDADELMAKYDALRARVKDVGPVENSTDIVRRFRENRESFEDETWSGRE